MFTETVQSKAIQKRMNSMLGHLNFGRFRDGYLLTGDSGCWHFLKEDQFNDFIKESMPAESEIYKELEADHFCFHGSKESFIRESLDEVRSCNNYLFAVTNECNNRCIYCQANGCGNLSRMDEKVADAALTQISNSPAKNITIEFQGGEPLMNFPIIRYIVLNASRILPEKNINFALVSNLSLITDEIAIFLKDNNVSISTSLDGDRDLHNMNRPAANNTSSFDNMLLGKRILEKYGVKSGAIQTTTSYALKCPESIVQTYAELGYHLIFLRPLTRLGAAARHWDEIGYTPSEYLAFYQKALKEIIRMNQKGFHLVEYHAALFLSKILGRKAVNYMELRSPCGAGLGQVAITSNGNVYTCDEGRMIAETGDEAFLIGNVLKDPYDKWISSSCCKAVCSASLLETIPGCCDCVFKPYCGVCPVVNYAINGSITHVSRDRCEIYKGILSILFNLLIEGDEQILNLFSSWCDQV